MRQLAPLLLFLLGCTTPAPWQQVVHCPFAVVSFDELAVIEEVGKPNFVAGERWYDLHPADEKCPGHMVIIEANDGE